MRSRFYLIIFLVFNFFLSISNSYGFNPEYSDSLLNVLKKTEDFKIKSEILIKLSDYYHNNNPEKALEYSYQALEIARLNKYSIGIIRADIRLAKIYRIMTNLNFALDFALKANDLAKSTEMKDELADSYNTLGNIYLDLGDYEISSEYLFKCLKLVDIKGNKKGIEQILTSIGYLFFEQNKYEKALEYFLKSLAIAREINDSSGISKGLNNIAAIYGSINEYEKVGPYLFEALKISKASGHKISEGINYVNIGVIYKGMNKYDSVYLYFKKAEAIFSELSNIPLLASVYYNLSEYYLENDNFDKSLEYAHKAFDLGRTHNLKKVICNAADKLQKIYIANNDPENAKKFQIIKYQVKDSMNLEQSLTNLSRLELQYDFEKQNHEKLIMQQKKDYLKIIIIILLLSIIITFSLILVNRRVKTKNVQLKNQRLEDEVEYKNKELALSVMTLLRKNEILSEISDKLIIISNKTSQIETKNSIKEIAADLGKNTDNEIWDEFELRFKQVHGDFYEKLEINYPSLTPNEKKICAFLKLNMSSKDISDLTGQSISAIEVARYRLRKKLKISNTDTNLITFLSQI